MPDSSESRGGEKQLAQALIDIHNALPEWSGDVDEAEWSDILAAIWDVLNRFPPGSLERVADQKGNQNV